MMKTRTDRTEACYRAAMRVALMNYLAVINPADAIAYGKLPYPELVQYAIDWMQTEAAELGLKSSSQSAPTPPPSPLEL